MRRFTCDCGNTLFFENTRCLQCAREVGFDPAAGNMVVLKSDGPLRRCANGLRYQLCNWLVPAEGGPLCHGCRLNRTIPDLSVPRNVGLWARLEMAKKRVVFAFLHLGLPLPSKREDPLAGLAFDFLNQTLGAPVMTGHKGGVITVNIEEADEVERERSRQNLREPSRTLLGHFRHETGHYVWDRWIGSRGSADLRRAAFRELFGDDSLDYGWAMRRYYGQGPPPGWESRYISAYATMHPWEDWAESWAHYLHILDGMETCESFGLGAIAGVMPMTRFHSDAGSLPAVLGGERDEKADADFLDWLHRWARLSTVLNEISSSLGQPGGLYPFVLSAPIARKLRFIHHLVREEGGPGHGA